MYRGIIQEAQWSGPGTYLRRRIEQYQLDKVVRHGRIWRLTYEGMERRSEKPRMLGETPAQLVRHLSHPNGWWRDTAQQLLVLSGDRAVVPALVDLARKSENQLARIHALWTLEGLGAADAALMRELMEDPDPQIRIQAIRASETLYKAGDRTFAADYRNRTSDSDVDVVMQAMMTMNTLKVPDAAAVIAKVMERNKAKGVQLVASTVLKPPSSGRGSFMEAVVPFTPEEQAVLAKGQEIYSQVCFACHGEDGRGGRVPGSESAPMLGPALASSTRVLGHENYIIKVLLHGVTGPLDGGNHPEMMPGFPESNDEWVAAVASYVRNSFGNRAPLVKAGDVRRIRAANAGRKTPWHTKELLASLPRPLIVDASWKLTASHNAAIAGQAVTLNPWTSGHAQVPGMWLQIELPAPVKLTELQFESPALPVDTTPAVPGAPTRSGGGRGGPGAPTVPGFPRGYEVEVSTDGKAWTPVAKGAGEGVFTDINFDPVQARFVRITQIGSVDNAPWTVRRLRLYEVPD